MMITNETQSNFAIIGTTTNDIVAVTSSTDHRNTTTTTTAYQQSVNSGSATSTTRIKNITSAQPMIPIISLHLEDLRKTYCHNVGFKCDVKIMDSSLSSAPVLLGSSSHSCLSKYSSMSSSTSTRTYNCCDYDENDDIDNDDDDDTDEFGSDDNGISTLVSVGANVNSSLQQQNHLLSASSSQQHHPHHFRRSSGSLSYSKKQVRFSLYDLHDDSSLLHPSCIFLYDNPLEVVADEEEQSIMYLSSSIKPASTSTTYDNDDDHHSVMPTMFPCYCGTDDTVDSHLPESFFTLPTTKEDTTDDDDDDANDIEQKDDDDDNELLNCSYHTTKMIRKNKDSSNGVDDTTEYDDDIDDSNHYHLRQVPKVPAVATRTTTTTATAASDTSDSYTDYDPYYDKIRSKVNATIWWTEDDHETIRSSIRTICTKLKQQHPSKIQELLFCFKNCRLSCNDEEVESNTATTNNHHVPMTNSSLLSTSSSIVERPVSIQSSPNNSNNNNSNHSTTSTHSARLLKMNDELITTILNEWVTGYSNNYNYDTDTDNENVNVHVQALADNDDDSSCWRGLERKVTSRFRQASDYAIWSVLDCQEYIRKQRLCYNQQQLQKQQQEQEQQQETNTDTTSCVPKTNNIDMDAIFSPEEMIRQRSMEVTYRSRLFAYRIASSDALYANKK